MQLTRAVFVYADVLSFVLLAVLAWALWGRFELV